MKVIFKILFFSRKADPRYAGNKIVMQHGANKATMPAKNDAIIDAEKIISIKLCSITKQALATEIQLAVFSKNYFPHK